ncbi:TPA: hypothetical protein ACX6RM_001294 [Photobacterium damselae]
MITGTITITETQDFDVTLEINTEGQGATILEVAHLQAIDGILKSPHFQKLVAVMALKGGFDCEKCQSKEKESEQPEPPIQEIQ